MLQELKLDSSVAQLASSAATLDTAKQANHVVQGAISLLWIALGYVLFLVDILMGCFNSARWSPVTYVTRRYTRYAQCILMGCLNSARWSPVTYVTRRYTRYARCIRMGCLNSAS